MKHRRRRGRKLEEQQDQEQQESSLMQSWFQSKSNEVQMSRRSKSVLVSEMAAEILLFLHCFVPDFKMAGWSTSLVLMLPRINAQDYQRLPKENAEIRVISSTRR